MFGRTSPEGAFVPASQELVRLALPRRVYTQSHVDRMIEIGADVAARASSLRGLTIVEAPPFLRHFTARFRPDVEPSRLASAAAPSHPGIAIEPRERRP
jgi:tryptophanase